MCMCVRVGVGVPVCVNVSVRVSYVHMCVCVRLRACDIRAYLYLYQNPYLSLNLCTSPSLCQYVYATCVFNVLVTALCVGLYLVPKCIGCFPTPLIVGSITRYWQAIGWHRRPLVGTPHPGGTNTALGWDAHVCVARPSFIGWSDNHFNEERFRHSQNINDCSAARVVTYYVVQVNL